MKDLSAKKKALLRALLEKEGLQAPDSGASIPTRPDLDSAPLSFAQERLWYLWRLAPGTAAYNIPLAAHLEGPLDFTAFRDSLSNVVSRHEALRTRLAFDGRIPVQEILPELQFDFLLEDLSQLEVEARDRSLQERMREYGCGLFDLEKPPLFRTRMLRLAPQAHIWLFTMHHIIADGWSLAILLREISRFYRHAVSGEPFAGATPALQFGDFASWQRRQVEGGAYREQEGFWLRQLAGPRPDIELPADHPRPPVQDFEGGWISRQLPAAVSDAARAMAVAERTTLLAVLLAAFKILLMRYSGQAEVLIGSPVTNRSDKALEEVFGNFVNTQVLRTRLHGGMTFREALRAVRQTLLEAYANQDLPVEQVIEKLGVPRDASRNPIFQTVFMLQEAPRQGGWRSALDLPDVRVEQLFTHTGTAKFDLTIEAEQLDAGLSVSAEYSRAIFEAATIERLLGHFEVLLKAGTQRPDALIARLPLLTSAEEQQFADWNRTTSAMPRQSSIHSLVEAWAESTPERTALSFEGRAMSYRELNQAANRLAHHLIASGLCPEDRVGVLADRSFETIVALLAILKAGGAYLPLDPDYPPERLAFMLSDGEVRILVAHEKYSRLADFSGRIVPLDTLFDHLKAQPENNLGLPVWPDSLAHIIYTSGSTGLPKGAGIHHRGVIRLVHTTDLVEVTPADTFMHFAPISFDAATLEIWAALVNGACLAIAPAGRLSYQELGHFIRDEAVTHVFLTAGLFHQMIEAFPGGLRDVRHLMTGGDVVSAAHIRRMLPQMQPGFITNAYGPTENACITTAFHVRDLQQLPENTPIGPPVSNNRAYILDKNLEPVPVGVVGELCAAGDGLARGYHNRPALTAESFVPDPFGPQGGRMYRTGDLARWRPDGSIDFIGRRDFQVKLRGYRIELGEIEAHLARHPGVRAAAALAQPRASGEKRLVAYVNPEPDGSASEDDLQTFLAGSLPAYMLPSAYVFLEAFPLTDNGKLDRNALPAPDFGRLRADTDFAVPQSGLQKTLAEIWQEVLEVEAVGIDDNFFDMGGNSLLLLRAHARIETVLGRTLSVIELFTHPTIRELAVALGGSGQEALDRDLDEVSRRVARRRRRSG